MRLGQLARKYDVSIDKILTYINETGSSQEELNPNSKIDEKIKELVAAHFEVRLENSPIENEADQEEIDEIPVEKIDEIENIEPAMFAKEELLLPESEYEEMPVEDKQAIEPKPLREVVELEEMPVEDKQSIDTDRLMELLETEDSEVDLSNITLIKAPKKELSGLKVLGKIELPEPNTKTTEKTEEQEKGSGPDRKTKRQHQQLSAEEEEEKRLKFKKRREEYDALQEKLEKEKQQKQRKALNKARYEQKKKQVKPKQPIKKDKIPEQEETPEVKKEQRPIPKTVFGKFWRWLDAP